MNYMTNQKNGMNQRLLFIWMLIIGGIGYLDAQTHPTFKKKFTEADTLRGMLTPARTCYDVKHYGLNIKIDPSKKYLEGHVDMTFEAKEDFITLQVDLFPNMDFDGAILLEDNRELKVKRRHGAVFINFGNRVTEGERKTVRMNYSGYPIEAKRAPWDGGFVWGKDEEGRDWIGVACEGDGASLWWPNKDHLSDEPDDGMDISVAVPEGLICVSNGNLVGETVLDSGYHQFDWRVGYPINNYNVTVNIAHYAHWEDEYISPEGDRLALDYYVLDYNLKKSEKHFQQVKPTLRVFEHYFGKYPFWEDGFALVETPYLGMEHQGAIAYGNQYMRGYLGGMIPDDMDFDYIIVHETGHEYFGNSISCNDHAEMWLHESFTTYMETLFVEGTMGYKDALRYINSQRKYIQNAQPIIGPMDVNWKEWISSDHYYKGAWILHTLRHAFNDDKAFFSMMKDFHEKNKIRNVTTKNFVDHVREYTDKDFTGFFEQYLYEKGIPTLQYKLKKKGGNTYLYYKWDGVVDGFTMPIGLQLEGERRVMISPEKDKWKKLKLGRVKKGEVVFFKELFLIDIEKRL